MAIDINVTGRAAKGWHEEIAKATKKAADYNEVRRDRTEKLRRAVTEVWAALEAGKTVNGFTRKEEWARWYNENARTKNPIRQIQKIIAGPKPKEANSVRVVTIRPGMTLKFVGFGELEGLTVKLKEGEAAVQLERNRKYSDAVRLPVTVVEEPKPQATEGELSSPQVAPVVAKKTWSQKKAEQGLENMKKFQAKKKTHAMQPAPFAEKTWCGKVSGTVAPKGAEPTCKVCAEKWNAAKRREEIKTLGPVEYMKRMKKSRTRKPHKAEPREGWTRENVYEWKHVDGWRIEHKRTSRNKWSYILLKPDGGLLTYCKTLESAQGTAQENKDWLARQQQPMHPAAEELYKTLAATASNTTGEHDELNQGS
jgi:hypothetical protein